MNDLLTIIPNWLPGWVGAGAAAGGGFGVIKWGAEFLAGRIDKRTAAIDSDTRFLFDSLREQLRDQADQLRAYAGRLDVVEKDLAECTHKHAKADAEVMRLQSMIQGYGQAREAAALIVAAERLETRGT